MEDEEIMRLERFRKEIDTIDDQILDLLMQRSGLVNMVGKLKHLEDTRRSIIRPGREAAMLRRITGKVKGVMSKAAVAYFWRLIIASSITIEEETRVSALSPQHSNECYWLAREYFGPFTPINKHPSSFEVVSDVVERRASVGVVPIVDEYAPRPWWVRLTEIKDPPHVFSRLPFIRLAPSQKPPLVTFGYIVPEPTGDDQSLWVIKINEGIAFAGVEALLKQSLGCKIEVADHSREGGKGSVRYYLIQCQDFVGAEDKRMDKFLANAPATLGKNAEVSACFLGSYATPITIEQ